MVTNSIDNTLFQDLPYRSEQLDMETMSNIFGGCYSRGQRCDADKDCCGDDLRCDTANKKCVDK